MKRDEFDPLRGHAWSKWVLYHCKYNIIIIQRPKILKISTLYCPKCNKGGEGNFKERGEQYGTIWDNMEIGATMICLHLKPDWRLSVPRRWTIWGNMKSGATIAPFPFGSFIGPLHNMEQYGAIWKVGQPFCYDLFTFHSIVFQIVVGFAHYLSTLFRIWKN